MNRMLQERNCAFSPAECQQPPLEERQSCHKQGPSWSSKDLKFTPEHGVARPWIQILSDPEGKMLARPARSEPRGSSEAPASRQGQRGTRACLQPPPRRREQPTGRSSPSQTLLRSGSATLLTSSPAALSHSPSAGSACMRGLRSEGLAPTLLQCVGRTGGRRDCKLGSCGDSPWHSPTAACRGNVASGQLSSARRKACAGA